MKKLLFLALSLAIFFSCSQTPKYELPAPEDVAMYQVNPRVFSPQNSFNAVAERLDSIKALGVNVVWFMPIYEVGQENSVNSPYCIKDYKAVNPEFGTIDDFNRLVSLCHEKGMSVIVDWVANHTSWDNAWLASNPEWYTQEDGKIISPANTGWLDVADLNFDNAEMRLAMIDAMKWWVVNTGVDGFRCDAADFVPFDFWKQAIDSLRAIPDRKLLMLAEGKRKDHFDAGFEMNYAWDFAEAMRAVFIKGESAETLYEADAEEYASLPEGVVKLRFTTNHDEAAKQSPIVEYCSLRGSMSAFVIATWIHGGALIYGSQEVGYPDPINFFFYVPVDWSANPELYQEYAKLIALYNQYPAIRKGELTAWPAEDAIVFEKADADARILVLANVRGEEVSIDMPEAWAAHECTDLMTGETVVTPQSITLAPYGYKLLKY